jgi:cyclopropane fatty-acyl-phospholipid synthase-like methyltransferase
MNFEIPQEWFESWFDSPYYHILYSNRDHEEAQEFIDHLLEELHLPGGSKILDLGCGKGRHSRHLHECGYNVTGVDLSEENIKYCKQYENDTLEFYVHDMRRLFRIGYYDAVFNLFTSFGYFEQPHQNELVVQAAAKSLHKGGYFLLDYFNAVKAVKDLHAETKIERCNITFTIHKRVENGFIIKDVFFTDKGKNYQFQEKVLLLSPDDMMLFFKNSGLQVEALYGDYKLNEFDKETSPRLLLLARKI